MPERISDTEPLLPPTKRSGIVTRSIVLVSFLATSAIALTLSQTGTTPIKQLRAATAPEKTPEKNTPKEIGELAQGTSLINIPLFIACEKDGKTVNIPACIERETKTNELIFHIDGKVFRNDEKILMLGSKATTAIESITIHSRTCVRLVSEANGHVDVPFELIRTIVPQLATTKEKEVVATTNVTFIPKEGTMMSGGQSAMNWIGEQFGHTNTADMTIKSVAFKQVGRHDQTNQIAQHR